MDKQTEKPKRKYTKKPKPTPKQLEPQDEQPKPVQKVIRFP